MATAARRFSRKPESASCLLSVCRERWFANSSEWLSPTDSIRRNSEAGPIAVRIGALAGGRCRAGRVLAVNLALHPDEPDGGVCAGRWLAVAAARDAC
jgi:hypothetical protein